MLSDAMISKVTVTSPPVPEKQILSTFMGCKLIFKVFKKKDILQDLNICMKIENSLFKKATFSENPQNPCSMARLSVSFPSNSLTPPIDIKLIS